MTKRTYLDSGVLIAAFKGNEDICKRAIEVLDDPERELLVSDAVWLEVMPKPIYEEQQIEVQFYKAIFENAELLSWDLSSLARAAQVAEQHGIAAMDAIHIAAALDAGANEFVTVEKSTKPMFRITGLHMESIRL